jgi:hypothetical protein
MPVEVGEPYGGVAPTVQRVVRPVFARAKTATQLGDGRAVAGRPRWIKCRICSRTHGYAHKTCQVARIGHSSVYVSILRVAYIAKRRFTGPIISRVALVTFTFIIRRLPDPMPIAVREVIWLQAVRFWIVTIDAVTVS